MISMKYNYFNCEHCVSKVNCEICAGEIEESLHKFGALDAVVNGTHKEICFGEDGPDPDDILDFLERIGVFER